MFPHEIEPQIYLATKIFSHRWTQMNTDRQIKEKFF
jgi:hypothetical protein